MTSTTKADIIREKEVQKGVVIYELPLSPQNERVMKLKILRSIRVRKF